MSTKRNKFLIQHIFFTLKKAFGEFYKLCFMIDSNTSYTLADKNQLSDVLKLILSFSFATR